MNQEKNETNKKGKEEEIKYYDENRINFYFS